jgi:tetratricopeptide (TPR) repeat protein
LNVNLGEPHYILGAISYLHDRDWKAAERALKTGMELDPNNIWGRNSYANFLIMMRRFEESIAVSEHSIKLNPLDPYGYLELAFPLNQLGQKEKAFELVNRSLELHPGYYNAKYGLALHYLRKGINLHYVYDFCEEELGHFNNDLQKIPSLRLGGIGQLLAMAGGQEEVESILNELIRRIDAGTEDTPYLALGILYTVLGETEKAIDYIEKSYEVREPFVFHINMRPGLDTLRSNRRFQDLLHKLGFET